MKVVSEKKEIVGTLSTLVGRFLLLELSPIRFHESINQVLRDKGAVAFHALNDEGFDCWIVVQGDMVVVPAMVHTMMDVKRVLTKGEEVLEVNLLNENLSVE